MLGIEPGALVAHADAELGRARCRRRLEVDEHALAGVVLVPVLDGVDDRLADGDADPVNGVVVETDVAADVVADDLHEVEHLERAGELEPQRTRIRH